MEFFHSVDRTELANFLISKIFVRKFKSCWKTQKMTKFYLITTLLWVLALSDISQGKLIFWWSVKSFFFHFFIFFLKIKFFLKKF